MNKKSSSKSISISGGSYIEEEEIIDQKFREYIHSKDSLTELTPHQNKFTTEELEIISQRFYQLCNDEVTMNYEQFRRGLGLLGREDSFICRIFNLIDHDGDGKITQNNYLNYLNIILKGSEL